MSKRLIVVLAVVWIVVLVAGTASSITLSLCGVLTGEASAASQDRMLVSTEEYETIERYERLQEILDIVKNEYYVDVDEEELITGALRGMLDSLGDPYTFYYTPEELTEALDHQEGSYEGVGMQVLGSEDGKLIVTRTFEGSSAREQGIQSGDCIRQVDGISVSAQNNQAMNEAIAMIKGVVGTEVTLTMERDGILMDFVVERRSIHINRVEYKMLDDNVGYLMLYEFMGDDVEGFKKAVKALRREGAQGLIIDIRSNPGGLLEDVVAICDMLLPKNLVVYIENRAGDRESFYSDDSMLGMPLVVLVNEMSASASEILAGSVQDTGVGTIVGQTTFGKGIVQTLIPFPSDGAAVQLTTATYYTPNGRSIHGSGIEPDVVVDSEGYDFTTSEPDPEQDAQLRKAIEIIREAIGS